MERKEKGKKFGEELTTEMHAEFMEGEMTPQELKILGVYGAMGRGYTREEALKRYGLTLEQYKKGYKKLFGEDEKE